MLADEAADIYTSGKGFAYDHLSRDKVVPINKGTNTRINIKVGAHSLNFSRLLHLPRVGRG